jgi:hypothetical protein
MKLKTLIVLLFLSIGNVAIAQGWFSPDRADVNDTGYSSAVVTIGTSQIEIKVGGSRDEKRQRVLIYNASTSIIFYGPSGVTTSGATRGIPLFRRQIAVIPVGDVAIYAIAASAGNDIIVQELK